MAVCVSARRERRSNGRKRRRIFSAFPPIRSGCCAITRSNEVVSFVKGGLQDLSISRTTFTWGVPVPEAPEHVMYVWVDALTNYITGVGFPDETAPNWRYWPAD